MIRPRGRVWAWVCILAVLFALAMPAAAGSPAVLAAIPALFGSTAVLTPLVPFESTSPPDPHRAAAVPARAPPLA